MKYKLHHFEEIEIGKEVVQAYITRIAVYGGWIYTSTGDSFFVADPNVEIDSDCVLQKPIPKQCTPVNNNPTEIVG